MIKAHAQPCRWARAWAASGREGGCDKASKHAWAMMSHAWAMMSHAWAMMSHAWAMMSHAWAMMSHARAMINHAWAMISHAWARMGQLNVCLPMRVFGQSKGVGRARGGRVASARRAGPGEAEADPGAAQAGGPGRLVGRLPKLTSRSCEVQGHRPG